MIGLLFFFFNDTATTEIYTLSLHDALPIWQERHHFPGGNQAALHHQDRNCPEVSRSEEHTSELQSRPHLVCRLLLEKKKQNLNDATILRDNHRQLRAQVRINNQHRRLYTER